MTQRARDSILTVIRTWWGPLTAIILVLGSYFTHRAESAHLTKVISAHIEADRIHPSEEYNRLLIISETEGMREALEDIKRGQGVAAAKSDVVMEKIRNISEKVEDLKKSLDR